MLIANPKLMIERTKDWLVNILQFWKDLNLEKWAQGASVQACDLIKLTASMEKWVS